MNSLESDDNGVGMKRKENLYRHSLMSMMRFGGGAPPTPIDYCQVGGIYVYSCVTNGYDLLFPPAIQRRDVKFALFSDLSQTFGAWRLLPLQIDLACPISSNRHHKFFPHRLFPNADYSIYIDGNIGIIGDISALIDEFIASNAAIGVFRHRDRKNVLEEVIACIDKGRFDDADMLSYTGQIKFMLSDGMPDDQPLTDNAIIFRSHKHEKLTQAMDDWWAQFNTYTKRDQISLPYVLWKNNVPTKIWNWSFRERNEYFEKYPHKGNIFRNIRIRLRNIISKRRFRR